MTHSIGRWPKFPPGSAGMVLVIAAAYGLATGLVQFATPIPAWRIDSPVELGSAAAVLAGLAWSLAHAVTAALGSDDRRRWWMASFAMVALTLIQATDWFDGIDDLPDVDLILNLPLWLTVALLLRGALGGHRRRPWASRCWTAGLALQLASMALDVAEGLLPADWPVSAERFSALTEMMELLCIEAYVAALVLRAATLVPVAAGTQAFPRFGGLAVGSEARLLFRTAGLFRSAKYPPVRAAFYPVLKELLLVVVCLGLAARLGGIARRAGGRSRFGQVADLMVLGFNDGVDPPSYYAHELYLPQRRAEAVHYLTRYETKNGLLYALNTARPQPFAGHEMNDKLLFAECCEQHGLAAAPVLMVAGAGAVLRRVPRATLDQDLFCKPRRGLGARGAARFRRVAPERYQDNAGRELSLDQLVERLRAAAVPVLVQPCLRNHADLAGFADASLVTIRVVTCLDPEGVPEVTHAMLRVLSKLEPEWPCNDEFGTPIDLADGRLGMVASDRLARCAERLSRHPVTGRPVAGGRLDQWPEVKALALAAHAAFAHRLLVGWDIAVTDRGALLLEGNTNLDVMFLQQVHRRGFGRDRLGALLRHHLRALPQVAAEPLSP